MVNRTTNRCLRGGYLLILMCATGPALTDAQEIRAAYCFPNGRAWTATVDLPKYNLLDIGPLGVPIGINDSGEVLLRNGDNQLIQWTWGNVEILVEHFTPSQQAFINENG